MYKIGIGVTTTPKRVNTIKDYLLGEHDDISFVIHNDTEGIGVSRSRNNLIKEFYDDGCEYIFLFDDDCYPVRKGWYKHFIESSLRNDIQHFVIHDVFNSPKITIINDVMYLKGHLGCFNMLSREVIEKIGYFNTSYNKYGWEDVAYCFRSKLAGMLGKNDIDEMPSPLKGNFYIHSEDVYHNNPEKNMSDDEKHTFIEENRGIFNNEIELAKEGKIYYPFENDI